MALLIDYNISVKEYDKINKYKDLKIEIEKMRHLKTTTMSVIMGALGRIKKGTDNHNTIHGSPSLYEIQKNDTLRNCSSPLMNTINMTEKYHLKETAKSITI